MEEEVISSEVDDNRYHEQPGIRVIMRLSSERQSYV